MKQLAMTGGAVDTLLKLYRKGPQEDGDLPSKAGFTDLFELGLAQKDYNRTHPNFLTPEGYNQAYLITHDLPEAYTTTVEIGKRLTGYMEAFHAYLKGPGRRGSPIEFGHPGDLTNLFAHFSKYAHEQGTMKGAHADRLYNRIGMDRFQQHVDARSCGLLIDPEIVEGVIVFRIVPAGPYGKTLQEQLDNGVRFKPGTRMLNVGHGKSAEVKQILGFDLIPEKLHMDTGADVCRPFINLN